MVALNTSAIPPVAIFSTRTYLPNSTPSVGPAGGKGRTMAGTTGGTPAHMASCSALTVLPIEGMVVVSSADLARTQSVIGSTRFYHVRKGDTFLDLARFYGFPMFSFAGCTDAKSFDQQAALDAWPVGFAEELIDIVFGDVVVG